VQRQARELSSFVTPFVFKAQSFMLKLYFYYLMLPNFNIPISTPQC